MLPLRHSTSCAVSLFVTQGYHLEMMAGILQGAPPMPPANLPANDPFGNQEKGSVNGSIASALQQINGAQQAG